MATDIIRSDDISKGFTAISRSALLPGIQRIMPLIEKSEIDIGQKKNAAVLLAGVAPTKASLLSKFCDDLPSDGMPYPPASAIEAQHRLTEGEPAGRYLCPGKMHGPLRMQRSSWRNYSKGSRKNNFTFLMGI